MSISMCVCVCVYTRGQSHRGYLAMTGGIFLLSHLRYVHAIAIIDVEAMNTCIIQGNTGQSTRCKYHQYYR